MEDSRKPIGILIILFLGMPSLFFAIWAVGITKAVSQPDFIPELPKKISEELPPSLEVLLASADHPQFIEDDHARAWILAAHHAETRPGELLSEIGFIDWLRDDLTCMLRTIYHTLEGRICPREITLNLKPLKRAYTHPAIDRYFREVAENLPPCNERQEAAWRTFAENRRTYNRRYGSGLPACRPDSEVLDQVARKLRNRCADMSNRVEVCDLDDFDCRGINLFSVALILALLLFLVPGFFITLGALVAEPFNRRFFQWSGLPLMAGGLLMLIAAALPKIILLVASKLAAWIFGGVQVDSIYWSPELVKMIMDQTYHLLLVVVDPLFYPVMVVALLVSLVGVLLLGISFLGRTPAEPYPKPPPLPRT